VSGHKWLSARAEARDVQSLLDQLHVTPADPEARFSALSGGNQQKAVLAKWMREKARVFLLQEPTAGVDVGAKATIYECLARIVGKGACALITTSDFEEACALCDRVIVLRSGTVCAVLTGADLAVDNILREALR
jgi:ribose transport system ATP-binding protein